MNKQSTVPAALLAAIVGLSYGVIVGALVAHAI